MLRSLATGNCKVRLHGTKFVSPPYNRLNMLERLKTIAAEIFGLRAEDIELTMAPEDVEKWDSLNHLRLITAVESEFDVRLSMSEIQNIKCLGDIFSYLDQ